MGRNRYQRTKKGFLILMTQRSMNWKNNDAEYAAEVHEDELEMVQAIKSVEDLEAGMSTDAEDLGGSTDEEPEVNPINIKDCNK